MATLTYDPTPADQPEFNEAEQEALALGEQAAQAESNLLAGKFEDSASLEQAYLELQQKLGERQETPTEAVDEPAFEDVEREVDKEGNTQLTSNDIASLTSVAGGREEYNSMIQWASDNLDPKQISMFNGVIKKGDPSACFFAINSLKQIYGAQADTEGKLLTGKASPERNVQFRSQAEVVAAMQNPRYDNDPAYRQDVFNALSNSNLDY